MLQYKSLVDLHRRLKAGDSGCLISGQLSLFFDEGKLLNIQCEEDNLWLLRRLIANEFLSKEEAYTLLSFPTLQHRLFLSTPREVWRQFHIDRARQNLFRWAHISNPPQFSPKKGTSILLLNESAEDWLAAAWRQREQLGPWYHGISHKWVYSQSGEGTVAQLCRQPLPLRRVIVRSPLEELQTIEQIAELRSNGHLLVGDSANEVLGYTVTEEDQEFFQDFDSHRGLEKGTFRFSKNLFDQIEDGKYVSPWSSKDAFLQFMTELNDHFKRLGSHSELERRVKILLHSKDWPTVVFQRSRWQSELLWRANCIAKEVFIEALTMNISHDNNPNSLRDINTWVDKWS